MKIKDITSKCSCNIDDVLNAASNLGLSLSSRRDRNIEIRDSYAKRIISYLNRKKDTVKQEDSDQRDASIDSVEETTDSPFSNIRLEIQTSNIEVKGEAQSILYIHKDALNELENLQVQYRKLAYLNLHYIVSNGEPRNYKTTKGRNRGWRRTPMEGYHFYMWWAPAGSPPVKRLPMTKNSVLIRYFLLHHDDTRKKEIFAGSLSDYKILNMHELVKYENPDTHPFSDDQIRFAKSTDRIKFIKGHPGSGKTTSLWIATQHIPKGTILYLTYGSQLAELATKYFSALGPKACNIKIYTFRQLFCKLTGKVGTNKHITLESMQLAFQSQLDGFRGNLGSWKDKVPLLFAEIYSHGIGRSIPENIFRNKIRNCTPDKGILISSKSYIVKRHKHVGKKAATITGNVIDYMRNEKELENVFPGPAIAYRALTKLKYVSDIPQDIRDLDCIIVDEIQDLTPVEYLIPLRMAFLIGMENGKKHPALFVAGDEGQVVMPTDFDWGEFSHITTNILSKRSPYILPKNLRSPINITKVVNRSWILYKGIEKKRRPQSYAYAEISDNKIADNVIYAILREESQYQDIIKYFIETPGTFLVYPDRTIPKKWSSGNDKVLSAEEAKGLDFQTVGVPDCGKQS